MHQRLSSAIPLSYFWDVRVVSLGHGTKLMMKAHPRHVTHQTTLCNSSSLSSHRTENKTPEKIRTDIFPKERTVAKLDISFHC